MLRVCSRALPALVLAFGASGCFLDRAGGAGEGLDAAAPRDAGASDAATVDATIPAEDAGGIDAGAIDASRPADASVAADAGAPTPDAAPPDAGPPDTGPPDTGPPDAGCVIEVCNGVDDDCDGSVDESNVCGCPTSSRGGRTYLFCASGMGWAAARAYCTARGYDLAVIEDAGEDAFLVSEIARRLGVRDTWIGLEDMATPGTYVWVNGVTAWSGSGPVGGRYNNWRGGAPENAAGQACVEIDGPSAQWADNGCGAGLQFICEGPVP